MKTIKNIYEEIRQQSYINSDINEISENVREKFKIGISNEKVHEIIKENYELECRKMMWSSEMNYIIE